MKITVLSGNAYGPGALARSSLNLAIALAERHDVEVLSISRTRDTPFFPWDERVGLDSLLDTRQEPTGPLARLVGDERRIDSATGRALRGRDSDVIIATQASLNLLAVRHAPRRTTVIGQEHQSPNAYKPKMQASLKRTYPRLAALSTTSDRDQRAWADFLPTTRISAIGYALSGGSLPQSRGDNRIIATARRQVPAEAGARLIDAMARVVDKRPDWSMRIYVDDPRLRSLVLERELHNHVQLMGATGDVAGAFAKASIATVTSETEGAGMTAAEALACGVPTVTHDGNSASAVVTDGTDGLIVPKSANELSAALLRLIEDAPYRHRLAANAVGTAERFDPVTRGEEWENLISDAVR